MISIVCLFMLKLSFAQPSPVEEKTISIIMESQKYSMMQYFFKEDFIFKNLGSTDENRFFRRLMVLESNRVLVLFSSDPQSYSNLAVEEFGSVADYNASVSDRSLRLEQNLIDRIRLEFGQFQNLKFSAKNRFSRLRLVDLGDSSGMTKRVGNTIFDSYLPTDAAPSELELVQASLFDHGFVTDQSFAHLPLSTATPNRYQVYITALGMFYVIVERSTVNDEGLPKIIHFIDLSGKILECEKLLVRAIQ